MPAGQIIGRVSVKVLPDTDDFRARARKQLTAIEKQLPELKVKTRIDMSGAKLGFLKELQKFNQQNRSMDSRKVKVYARFDSRTMNEEITKGVRKLNEKAEGRRINIRANMVANTLVLDLDKKALQDVEDKLKRWRDKMSPLEISVKPNLMLGSTTLIEKRLDYMTRPRKVPIVPMLNMPATMKVATGLATLIAAGSGARVLTSTLESLWDTFKNLDKIAPKIGAVGLGILGIGGYALSAASNLFALSSSLASIGAVGLTLPATFAAAAIGVGTLIAVLKDFNKVLPQVKQQLANLQDSMSEKFWAKAKAPVKSFIDDLLPQFTKGFNAVSVEMGSFTATFATAFKGLLGGPVLDGMFDGMIRGLQNAEGAAKPLAGIITTLGSIGAQYLPQMGTWLAVIADQFNTWLGDAASDGRLKQWIDNGLAALHDLGQVAKNVGGILSGLSKAASASGGSSLGMMADTLERVNKAVNSKGFQTGLIAVLTAAHAAMNTIATVSGPAVSELFKSLSDTLATVLPIVGQTIGTALSAIAGALASPDLQSGLVSLFQGLSVAVEALAPAMAPIAGMLGALGKTLGNFLAVLGPIFATVFGALAQVFQALLPAINPVISVLGNAFLLVLQALAPVIVELAGAFTNLIAGALPVLGEIIGALIPVIRELAPIIGEVLLVAFDAIAALLPTVGALFAAIVPLIGQLVVAIAPLITAALPLVASLLGAIIPIITILATTVLPPVIAAISALVAAIVPVITQVIAMQVAFTTLLLPVFALIGEAVAWLVTTFIGGFTSMFAGVMSIFEGFKTMFSGGITGFFTGLGQILSGVWDVIVGLFNVFMFSKLLGIGKSALGKIGEAFTSGFGKIQSVVNRVLNWLRTLATNVMNQVRVTFATNMRNISSTFGAAWNTIKQLAVMAMNGLTSAVSRGISTVVSTVRGLPGKAASALGNVGSALANAGRRLIQGFIGGIKSAIGGVKDTLQGLTKKLTDWKGPESLDKVLLVNAGQLVIGGFIKGLESQYDAVHRSLNGLTDSLASSMEMAIDVPVMANVTGAVDGALASSSDASTGNRYEINVPMMPTNSTPEDVADAILFAQKRFAYGSAYAS